VGDPVRVSLKDAALVVGLPCSREEFDAAVRGKSDFLATLPDVGTPERVWSFYEAQLVRPAQEVIGELRQRGVPVLSWATLADVQRVLAERRLVGIVGHHPFVPVSADDVLSPERLLAAVSSGEDAPTRELRAALSAQTS
jgi:hypothetical protein